jgi:hypothetical protein
MSRVGWREVHSKDLTSVCGNTVLIVGIGGWSFGAGPRSNSIHLLQNTISIIRHFQVSDFSISRAGLAGSLSRGRILYQYCVETLC